MKKIKLNAAKLQLKKEQILSLSNEEMNAVQGGTSQSVSIMMSTYTYGPQTNPPQPEPQPQPVTLQANTACANVSIALRCY